MPPQTINTIPADEQLILTWASIENADSYNLYIATEGGITTQNYLNLENVRRIETVTSPHIISDLENGKKYFIVLSSQNAGGESVLSKEISVSPISSIPPPATPQISNIKIAEDKISLHWKKVEEALFYQLYITYPDNIESVFKGSTQQIKVEGLSFVVDNLEINKTYLITLSAANESGESDLTDVLELEPKKIIRRPSKPKNISLSLLEEKNILITWPKAENVSQYDLFMSTDGALSSHNYKQLTAGRTESNVHSPFQISDLLPGTYYFIINAKNISGSSLDSRLQSITVPGLVVEQSPPEADLINVVDNEKILEEKYNNTPQPYEKLSAAGERLLQQYKNYNQQPWACVRDKKTSEVWEVKVAKNNYRNARHVFSWRGEGAKKCVDNLCSVEDYILKLNQVKLCGFTDWRLPTREELASLLDKSQRFPRAKINTDFFPNTANDFYWTGTPYLYDEKLAWFVYFSSGYVYFDIKSNPMHLRLVRTGK